MIQAIIALIFARRFWVLARGRGYSPFGWALIGMAAFFLPSFLLAFLAQSVVYDVGSRVGAAAGGAVFGEIGGLAGYFSAIVLSLWLGVVVAMRVSRHYLEPASASRPPSADGRHGSDEAGQFRRGVELLEKRDCSGALREFQASLAVAKDDQKADSLYNIAVCNAKLGDLDAALRAVEQAIALDPALAAEIATDADFGPLSTVEKFQQVLRHAEGKSVQGQRV